MRTTIALVCVVTMPHAAAAEQPGWCGSGGLNPSEQAICSEETLWFQENDMAAAYAEARAADALGGRKALREDQRHWLAFRNTCGTDTACLERRYRYRVYELQDAVWAEASGTVPVEPDIAVQGGGAPVVPTQRFDDTTSEVSAFLQNYLTETEWQSYLDSSPVDVLDHLDFQVRFLKDLLESQG